MIGVQLGTTSDGLATELEKEGYKVQDLKDITTSVHYVAYLGIPVSKDAFPRDIAAQLDSMAVGSFHQQ